MIGMALIAALLLVSFIAVQNFIKKSTEAEIQLSLHQTSELLNLAIAPYATHAQIKTLQDYLSELIGNGDGSIRYVVVSDGKNLMLRAGEAPTLPLPPPLSSMENSQSQTLLHIRQPLLIDSDTIGFVQYGYATDALLTYRNQLVRDAALGSISVFLLGAVLVSVFTRQMGQRLMNLNTAFEAIASGDYSQRVPITNTDELSKLAGLFNRMTEAVEDRWEALIQSRAETQALNASLEDRVAARTHELASANQELQRAFEDLRHTQAQLVQSEKMAALGQLVAGIAHELNTPIGNALTVATTIDAYDHDFQKRIKTGIKRSEFEELLKIHTESLEILLRSLQRATKLIGSFKQVAVDQVSDQRREFVLEKTLHEIITSLEPMYRKRGIQLELSVDPDIVMESYPGAIIQIITNLVSNAVTHAFEGRETGLIRVSAEKQGEEVHLIFADNGNGIAPENIRHVFEPFFTTKMGQGGTGLGLHICFNLINSTLGGRISVASKPDQGTHFEMHLPIHAPLNRDITTDMSPRIAS